MKTKIAFASILITLALSGASMVYASDPAPQSPTPTSGFDAQTLQAVVSGIQDKNDRAWLDSKYQKLSSIEWYKDFGAKTDASGRIVPVDPLNPFFIRIDATEVADGFYVTITVYFNGATYTDHEKDQTFNYESLTTVIPQYEADAAAGLNQLKETYKQNQPPQNAVAQRTAK